MSTEEGLLAAVVASPDDDLPRLVLADWYDENGQPERAELIRVQCSPLYTTPCGQIAYPLDDRPDIGVGCTDLMIGREDIHPSWCPQCQVRHRVRQILVAWDDDTTRHIPHPHAGNGWTGFVVKTYERGLLHTVRCTSRAFFGGECERCSHLLPHMAFSTADDDCPHCNGQRRTPGIGPAVCGRQPVVRVELTDRGPLETVMGDLVWNWTRMAGHDRPYILPKAVFDMLPARMYGSAYEFPTRDLALTALSDALISWARSRPPAEAKK